MVENADHTTLAYRCVFVVPAPGYQNIPFVRFVTTIFSHITNCLCFSLCVCLCISLPVCLSPSLSMYLSLNLSLSLCYSLSISQSFPKHPSELHYVYHASFVRPRLLTWFILPEISHALVVTPIVFCGMHWFIHAITLLVFLLNPKSSLKLVHRWM